MPFKTILLIIASLLIAGGGYYAAQVHVDKGIMKEDMKTINKGIPPIDIKRPTSVETATFAMG